MVYNNKFDLHQEMTQGASIELAEELELKYEELNNIGMEISGNLETLKNPAFLNSSPVTWFKYFKTCLVYIPIIVIVVYLLASIANFKVVSFTVATIISAAVIVLPILASILCAKIKNDSVEKEYKSAVRRKAALEERTYKLKARQEELLTELGKYEKFIPVQMRNKASMTKAKIMLAEDKAFSFQEAVKKIAGNATGR